MEYTPLTKAIGNPLLYTQIQMAHERANVERMNQERVRKMIMQSPEPTHSSLQLVKCCIGLICGCLLCAAPFVGIGAAANNSDDSDSTSATTGGEVLWAFVFLSICGLATCLTAITWRFIETRCWTKEKRWCETCSTSTSNGKYDNL